MTIRENEFNYLGELIAIAKSSFPNNETKQALTGMENILHKVKKRDSEEKGKKLKEQQQNLFSEVKA